MTGTRPRVEYEYAPDYATSQYCPPGEAWPPPGITWDDMALLVATVRTRAPYRVALPFPKRLLRRVLGGGTPMAEVIDELAEELEEAMPAHAPLDRGAILAAFPSRYTQGGQHAKG